MSKGPHHRGFVNALGYGSDGTWIASAGQDGTIRFWDTTTGRLLQMLEVGKGAIHALADHPQGRWLFSAGDDGQIRRWVLGNPEIQ